LFIYLVGLGWSPDKREELMNANDDYVQCSFDLYFQFEQNLQKFPRVACDPNHPAAACINHVDFAILHRNDIQYPAVHVETTFDFLNYNFFCEQYSKVIFFFWLFVLYFFFDKRCTL